MQFFKKTIRHHEIFSQVDYSISFNYHKLLIVFDLSQSSNREREKYITN